MPETSLTQKTHNPAERHGILNPTRPASRPQALPRLPLSSCRSPGRPDTRDPAHVQPTPAPRGAGRPPQPCQPPRPPVQGCSGNDRHDADTPAAAQAEQTSNGGGFGCQGRVKSQPSGLRAGHTPEGRRVSRKPEKREDNNAGLSFSSSANTPHLHDSAESSESHAVRRAQQGPKISTPPLLNNQQDSFTPVITSMSDAHTI